MKIVVTQDIGFTYEQRAELTKLSGSIKFYDTQPSSGEEWLRRVEGADIVCSHIKGLSDCWMELKNVYLTIPSVSTKFMQKQVFEDNNVILSTSPGCNKAAVSEWVVAMLLRHVRRLDDFVNASEMNEPRPVICNTIHGSKVCIIGKGNIGIEVRKKLVALDAEVVYCTRKDDIFEKTRNQDFVIDCVSENSSTKAIYDSKFFDNLDRRSVFISVSRAVTKNYDDLFEAISNNRFSHYITDNASSLNYDVDDHLYKKLLKTDSVSVTPHIAAYTETTIRESSRICFENIVNYIEGNPQNLAFQ